MLTRAAWLRSLDAVRRRTIARINREIAAHGLRRLGKDRRKLRVDLFLTGVDEIQLTAGTDRRVFRLADEAGKPLTVRVRNVCVAALPFIALQDVAELPFRAIQAQRILFGHKRAGR
ncbi:hypothetical protein D3C87_1242640 [compost metagenome]